MTFSNRPFLNFAVFVVALFGFTFYLSHKEHAPSANAKTVETPTYASIMPHGSDTNILEVKVDSSLCYIKYEGRHLFSVIPMAESDTTMKIDVVFHSSGQSTYFVPYESGKSVQATEQGLSGIYAVTVVFRSSTRWLQCTAAVGGKISTPDLLGSCR